jgi:hypothetical protein
MTVDVLSDVLHGVRLRGAVFYWIEAVPPWVAVAEAAQEVAAAVMPGAEHVMAFHVVVEGECWASLPNTGPERAQAGDVVIFPQGDAHAFTSAPDLPVPALSHMPNDPAKTPFLLRIGQERGPPQARFVCGFLGCDARPFNPLLAALPHMLHVASGGGAFGDMVRLAAAASASPRPGGEALRARLAEMMFVEAVRGYLARLPEGAGGWLGGLRDAHVGRAL